VAHTCNTSYSEGRDQEEQGLKPALGFFWDPILKKKKKSKGWWSGSSGKSDSDCQASMRVWVQTPVLQEKKKTFKTGSQSWIRS
jgi:hypothetical protein